MGGPEMNWRATCVFLTGPLRGALEPSQRNNPQKTLAFCVLQNVTPAVTDLTRAAHDRDSPASSRLIGRRIHNDRFRRVRES